jgi:hypothetical protein
MSDHPERPQRHSRRYRQGAEDFLVEDILRSEKIFCNAACGRLFGLVID